MSPSPPPPRLVAAWVLLTATSIPGSRSRGAFVTTGGGGIRGPQLEGLGWPDVVEGVGWVDERLGSDVIQEYVTKRVVTVSGPEPDSEALSLYSRLRQFDSVLRTSPIQPGARITSAPDLTLY
eukprot:766947-Hanusia_phi.AAC.7